MKVISKLFLSNDVNRLLIQDKEYEVIVMDDDDYKILCEDGNIYWWPKTDFKEVKMSKVNYNVLPNSIVINYEGKNWNLHKADIRFNSVLDAIKQDKLDTIPDLLDTTKAFAVAGFQVKDNNIFLDGEILEGVLADRIIKLQAAELPFTPLIKFARKLRKNPSFNSREQLYKFLEHNGHPLTSEGNFIAYRGVTEDFKDKHTRTFDNSIGAVCEMVRSTVDDNPNNTCSKGLHVACYDYAKGFAERIVEVEVDPQDVVCVPADYNGTKMRTCKFKVVSLCEGLNTSELVDSAYESSQDCEFKDNCGIDDDLFDSDISDDSSESDESESEFEDYALLTLKNSNLVDKAEYNESEQDLIVFLKDGSCYKYYDVNPEIADECEEAKSTGVFYINEIAHSFEFDRMN